MSGNGEEEFDEGEVWDVLQDSSKEAALSDFTPPTRSRRGAGRKNKGAAEANDDEEKATGASMGKGRRSPSSSTAPVAIPHWCSSGRSGAGGRRRDQEEDNDDEAGDVLPPHEWLAKKMEKMSTTASSPDMMKGRSKGRVMRKFRDALLPKTAFSEQ